MTGTILGIIGGLVGLAGLVFAILTYAKSQQKAALHAVENANALNTDIQVRLVKIETDVAYIRQAQDEDKEWKQNIEKRINKLEKSK